jgi:hypothetical protein
VGDFEAFDFEIYAGFFVGAVGAGDDVFVVGVGFFDGGCKRSSIALLERRVLRVLRARREAFSSQVSMSLVATAWPLGQEYSRDKDGKDIAAGPFVW